MELSTTANKKITISCIYRHPCHNFKHFQDKFSNTLEILNNKNSTYVIGGDFNINYSSDNQNILNYINEIESQGTNQIVKYETRFSINSRKSLLDHNYTNLPDTKITNHCIAYDISDHLPSLTFIKSLKYSKSKYGKKLIRDERKFNPEDFLTELNVELSKLTYSFREGMDINEMWNKFEDTFLSVLNLHAPMRYQTRSELKRNNKPWLTRAILKSIKCKQKLYHKILKNPSPTKWKRFKIYRN